VAPRRLSAQYRATGARGRPESHHEVRFHQPAHPGDALTLELKWTEKRRSRSKPDRGIVTGRYSLLNAAGGLVMSHLDTVLMRLRNPD
jgi:acyl dehydratase